jgi:hypothetical protein
MARAPRLAIEASDLHRREHLRLNIRRPAFGVAHPVGIGAVGTGWILDQRHRPAPCVFTR